MRPIRPAALLLLSLLVALPVAAQNIALPEIGDPSRGVLGPDEERRLGAAVLHRLREQGLAIDDVQLGEYLGSIGQRVAAYADRTDHPYTFFWVDDPSINAFAAPGGFIGVHAGLLLATQDEAELAGVLAHEVAHVSQRHIARFIAESRRLTIPLAAAVLAGILVAQANSELGQAAIAGSMAAGSQLGINFTRANELEADRIGTRLLVQAGYDPNGLADFFKRLERLSGGSQLPELLRTHPLPTSRIAETQDLYGGRSRQRTARDETTYHMAKARMRVLINPNTQSLLREFQANLNNATYADESAERYGYALALKRAGRYAEAGQQVARLLEQSGERLAFRLEEAEIALARGERERAWRLFAELERLYPDDYTLAIHYGQALAVQGNPRQAMQILEPHLRRRVGEAPLYALYAQAAQRVGDVAQAHASLVEYYYLNGQLEEAIEQAELGLRHRSVTPYLQARLQARLRQLKDEALREKER